MFHDTEDWGTHLHGLDVTVALPDLTIGPEKIRSFLDLFAIAFRVEGSTAAIPYKKSTLNGSTDRQDGGFRWFGTARDLEFSVGGLYQGGTFENGKTRLKRPVEAYAFNSILGWRHSDSFLHPFLGLQADLYSGGDTTRNSGAVGTYMTPFNPQTNYLDTTTYIAPSNLVSLSPVLRLTPLPFVSVQFKAPFMWRDNTKDGIYSSSSAYGFYPIHGGYIGVIPQAALTVQIGRHLTWQQYGARFMTSPAMRQAGAKSGSYYQSNFVFRF